jgi:hypothetical protein
MEPVPVGMGSGSDETSGMREPRCDPGKIEAASILSLVDGLNIMQVENLRNVIENLPIRQRHESDIKRIVVHRNSLGENAREIARRYKDEPEIAQYTGGKMAYPLVLLRSGVWEQVFDIDISSPHAAQFNHSGLGLAVVGDFQTEHPTKAQWTSLIEMVALLRLRLFIDTDMIYGHDELPDTSPDKICPGKNLDMDELRIEVSALIRTWAYERCHQLGLAL